MKQVLTQWSGNPVTSDKVTNQQWVISNKQEIYIIHLSAVLSRKVKTHYEKHLSTTGLIFYIRWHKQMNVKMIKVTFINYLN